MKSRGHSERRTWVRLPGLYRRFELLEVTTGLANHRIEPAGRHACGTELFAVYVSPDLLDAVQLCGTRAGSGDEVPPRLTCPRCKAKADEFEVVRGYGNDKPFAVCMICNCEAEVEP